MVLTFGNRDAELAPRGTAPAAAPVPAATPGAKGLHDAEGRLRGRELEGRLRLDHLRADDVAEVERVVDVLHVLVGYLRDVDRALRLPRDLALRAVDRR